MTPKTNRLKRFARRLRNDTSGLALIEFAYTLPFLMAMSIFGLELTNLAMVNHKISQAASAMADNMSRVGLESTLSVTQIRESDVVDSFIGMSRQLSGLDIGTRGRVFLSQLQVNAEGGQWVLWQRCGGMKNVAPAFGGQGSGATGTAFPGMGPTGAKVTAPVGGAVMFVEVQYDYLPLTPMYIQSKTLKYHSGFIVRDDRDLTKIYNPSPAATVMLCSLYNTF